MIVFRLVIASSAPFVSLLTFSDSIESTTLSHERGI